MQRLALLAAATTALQRPPVLRRVEVEVTRQLDGVSPQHARDAWLDYSWTSGGGIPALVLREPADAKLPSVRTLVPRDCVRSSRTSTRRPTRNWSRATA